MAHKRYFCPLRPNFSVGGNDKIVFRNHTLATSDPAIQRVIERHRYFGEHITVIEIDGEPPPESRVSEEKIADMSAKAEQIIAERIAKLERDGARVSRGATTSADLEGRQESPRKPAVEPQKPFTQNPAPRPTDKVEIPDPMDLLTMPKRGLQDVLRQLKSSDVKGASEIKGNMKTELLRDAIRTVLTPIWRERG